MSDITTEELRANFEEAVASSEKLKASTPLGIMEINGKFHHYMNPDTDTLWIGFAAGMKWSKILSERATR